MDYSKSSYDCLLEDHLHVSIVVFSLDVMLLFYLLNLHGPHFNCWFKWVGYKLVLTFVMCENITKLKIGMNRRKIERGKGWFSYFNLLVFALA